MKVIIYKGVIMKAKLIIECEQCRQKLGIVNYDTSGVPGQLGLKVDQVVLKHRPECKPVEPVEVD